MQSTLYQPKLLSPHIAAAMDGQALLHLPELAGACAGLGVEVLTVSTLPADLRLAEPVAATAMLDNLAEAVRGLDGVDVSLLGRTYYLPDHVRNAVGRSQPGNTGFRLRIAVDYACRTSFLSPGADDEYAAVLLPPAGSKPGNLLRWHYAGAALRYVDWRNFESSRLAALLDVNSARQPGAATQLRGLA